jgi:hypothetical protein
MGREGVRILELEAMDPVGQTLGLRRIVCAWGKPWDRQPICGKLRRKSVSVPGLRRSVCAWGKPWYSHPISGKLRRK